LNREIVRVLQNPTGKEQLRVQGFEVRTTCPEQLGEMMRMDAARWIEVVRKAGIDKID
jgi:tripartite-type tricarboxylate transporter receptor subunit TctC